MQDQPTNLYRRVADWLHQYWQSFSFVGLVFATLFFAGSVTPSLLPRHFALQGILSGFALAIGYGAGNLTVWLWTFWELPIPGPRSERVFRRVTVLSTSLVFVLFLRQMTFWQNSIRELMEMEPLQTAYPYRTGLIAVIVGVLTIGTVRRLVLVTIFFAAKLNHFLPRRVSYALGTVIVLTLFVGTVNGVIARTLLVYADASFSRFDELVEDNMAQPERRTASGSSDSLITWDTIGRRGKLFILDGPSKKDLEEFSGMSALQPLRIYVGLRSRETMKQRAELALEELKRVGGFDRSVLVLATPTGTGWLDPSAVDTLEYLHNGDTAIVSTQYSYLPSWLTITVDPDRSRRSARILFEEIYDYWKTLPKDSRPRLYLHGLSLGSLGSESCADLFTIFEDPMQGALWSGPPFPSPHWKALTAGRNKGTPAWLPEFRDGAMVRFTGHINGLNRGTRWGPIRSVYVQYASDPMVFFSTDLLFREPEWLQGQRGPDVSPHLRWYPIITFLQIAFDLPVATSVPMGYGHNYAPKHYIDAWIAVTEPVDWAPEKTRRLKALFADRIPPAF